MLVFWRIFFLPSTVEITTREYFRTNVFSREIFRISLVVELGLNVPSAELSSVLDNCNEEITLFSHIYWGF
jgi:hypothetical protein